MGINIQAAKSSDVALQYHILRQLYFGKELSCSKLSEQVKKSIPLVSKTVNVLLKSGHIIDRGLAPSNGGRRPQMYALPSGSMYMVAVAMDQLSTRVVILDLLNNYITAPETIEIALEQNPEALPKLIKSICGHILKSGIKQDKIIGVGIAMPGFINASEGINYTFLKNWSHGSLRNHLEQALGLPTYIDNDSSLIALAELRFGLAKNCRQAMVINIGWGTGLGMIVNGELFRGYTGYAGEFSHIPVSDNDVLCECGKRGCLETEASLLVVAHRAIEEVRKGGMPAFAPLIKSHDPQYACDVVIAMANKGNQPAIELLSDVAYRLGKGIAILIHIMNPELVVLSGRGAQVGKVLMAPVQHALNRYCIPRLLENTELKVSHLGYDAELIGAAALVMEHFGAVIRLPKK